MEESVLAIAEEMHKRLKTLVARKDHVRVPKNLREDRKNVVLIGRITNEERAIALLYSEVMAAHDKMHARTKLPFGVNSGVGPAHYCNHVMMDLLYEMFMWSIHRNFRHETDGLRVRFDAEWNIYAPRPRRLRKKKRK